MIAIISTVIALILTGIIVAVNNHYRLLRFSEAEDGDHGSTIIFIVIWFFAVIILIAWGS